MRVGSSPRVPSVIRLFSTGRSSGLCPNDRCLKYPPTTSDMPKVRIGGSTATLLAVFDGGPGDGQEHVMDAATVEVTVDLDHSLHLYERVPSERMLSDGRRAVILQWRGRYGFRIAEEANARRTMRRLCRPLALVPPNPERGLPAPARGHRISARGPTTRAYRSKSRQPDQDSQVVRPRRRHRQVRSRRRREHRHIPPHVNDARADGHGAVMLPDLGLVVGSRPDHGRSDLWSWDDQKHVIDQVGTLRQCQRR